jgi:predicted RND superfamily exporter protein
VNAGRFFERLVGFAVRLPWLVLAVVLALAIAGAVAAFGLQTDAGTDTLVDEDSTEFQATERFREKFGDDAAVILVRGDLRKLVLT